MSVKDGFIEVSNFKGKYVFGSLATYHCNPGYILWGNASRLCTEVGTWTGLRPQCKPITCGQPPEVTNTRFHLMNGTTSWQSLAKYTCKPGHSMVYEKRKFFLVCNLDILFSSNHNIHKSSYGLCFWASDSFIERF